MDIGINEIICTSAYYINDSKDLCYDAESKNKRPSNCQNPKCKCTTKPHYHSKSRNLLKDINSDGKIVYINLTIKRYRCPECKHVFNENYNFYDRTSFLTNRLKAEIIRRSTAGESSYQLAKEYKIDNKTILNVTKNFFEKNIFPDYKTNKIGICTHFIKKQNSIIVLDLEKNKVIEVRNPYDIDILSSLTQMSCEYYVLDIEPSELKLISDKSENIIAIHPNAIIEYVKSVLFKQILEENKHKSYEKEPIEKYFLRNWTQLNKTGILVLNTYFKKHPEHYKLYILKELLMDIYNICSSKEEADILFNTWFEVFKELVKNKENAECLYQIKEHILNHWIQKYDDTFFSKTREIFSKIEKKGKRCTFSTVVKRSILSIYYEEENEPLLTVSKMTETKEKVHLLYNKYNLNYNAKLPIEFSHRLQAHIYLYLKEIKKDV